MICGAAHPDDATVTCGLREDPTEHEFHYGYSKEHGNTDWPNPEYQPKVKLPEPGALTPKALAAAVARGILSKPDANTVGIMPRDPHETTADAAFAVMPRTGTQRMAVLHAIASADSGLTDEEARTALGLRYSSECARRQELVKGGWVEDSGQRRSTTTGQDAIVWVLTPEGRSKLS